MIGPLITTSGNFMTNTEALVSLRECIKQLTCMVGSNGDKFIEERLTLVFNNAEKVVASIIERNRCC